MADTIEEKWPQSMVGCVIFLFILVLMLATVVPNDLIDRAMYAEHQMGQKMLSQSEMAQVISTTDRIYVAAIIHSGIKETVTDLFMPSGPRVADAFEEKVDWWFDYISQRGEAIQKILYQIVYRGVLAAYWLPFFAAVAVPAVFAGFMRWNAKRYAFDYSSPLINNNAARLLVWGAIIMLIGVIFPAPLPPLVVCTLLIAVMPTVISLLISNLPKRV